MLTPARIRDIELAIEAHDYPLHGQTCAPNEWIAIIRELLGDRAQLMAVRQNYRSLCGESPDVVPHCA